ncbi:ABC transporter substrate-binding protein [Clostridia bacterium]|nr:ABC transporter substrate-binding protein [Clostridia bacterium]
MKKLVTLLLAVALAAAVCMPAMGEVVYPLVQPGESITLRVVFSKNAIAKPLAEMKIIKDLQEISGVTFDIVEIPSDGFDEKKNLMIVSGDLPDVFFQGLNTNDIINYKDQDIFIPVTELIETSMPNLKGILDTHPEYKAAMVAPDGEIWGFPRIEEMYGLVCNQGILSVNQTWLTQLGLSIPKTVDEFKDMLIAFRDGDPNGNGVADEIPFMFRIGESKIGSWRNNQSIGQFFGCWGQADTGDRLALNDGKVISTAVTDAYKEGLKYFADLWKEGLIDPDMPLNDGAAYQAKLNANPAIVGAVEFFSIIDVVPADRRAEYVAIPYLTGPNGEYGVKDNISEMHSVVMAGITTACKYPEIAASVVDLSYDPQRSVEINWGPIDEYYELDPNGVMQWMTYDILPAGIDTFSQLRQYSTPVSTNIVLNEYYDTVVAYPLDAADLYSDMTKVGFIEKHLSDPIIPPHMWYDPEDQERISLISGQIYNLIDNYNATAITDGNVDATWDAYIASLETAGLSEYLSIVQKTYDAYALVLDTFIAGVK